MSENGARMNAIRHIHRIRELAFREADGIQVALIWDSATDDLTVCVSDTKSESYFELSANPANAFDVFHHPYSYAASRGIAYDDTSFASTDHSTEHSIPRAA